jgi:oligopeptide/dipeptide ABC transporter ATP-binding protein
LLDRPFEEVRPSDKLEGTNAPGSRWLLGEHGVRERARFEKAIGVEGVTCALQVALDRRRRYSAVECAAALLAWAAPLLAGTPAREKLRQRVVLAGDPPSPLNPPSGCAFHPRCRFAVEACKATGPALEEISPGRDVACLRARELQAGS